jgi:transcriptional regulator with XRE-family HTH domain
MDEVLIDGEQIRRCRKNKGWSQMDLARYAWVDQGTISALERNTRLGIRLDTLVRLARSLGVKTDELLVPPDGAPVQVDDPKLDVMARLVHDLTTEERESAEMFIRFVLAQRRRKTLEAKKQTQPAESAKPSASRSSARPAKRKA